ncbi:hypothetical protein IPM62_04075 [Candidatus Woesebacteria bacterium]|nr:MAG: hypothetical protein IPM62_04075 [Candidatus Woesebacteria bacterium]
MPTRVPTSKPVYVTSTPKQNYNQYNNLISDSENNYNQEADDDTNDDSGWVYTALLTSGLAYYYYKGSKNKKQ